MISIREAMFCISGARDSVDCSLCPQNCHIPIGERGRCRGRENIQGKLIAVNYARSIGESLDPIEKKPLYHFHPGSRIVSLGANSCNLSCFWCQNFTSSQKNCATHHLSSQDLYQIIENNSSVYLQVAFTYTEPFTWFEYIYDFAQTYPDVDIVLVTNGFVSREALAHLLPRIKAMNIDLKSMDEQFYKEHCGGELQTVKDTIEAANTAGVHLELTNLLIPGLNDSPQDIVSLAQYIATVNPNIPLHISAYHPAFNSSIPATHPDKVEAACALASEYLAYVYAGNVADCGYSATRCPSCKTEVINTRRIPKGIDSAGNCSSCGYHIYGVY